MLFGSLKSGSKGSQKQQVCREITTGVSSIGVGNQSPADVSICKSYTHQIMYRLYTAYTGYMYHHSGYYSFGCNLTIIIYIRVLKKPEWSDLLKEAAT